MSLRQKAFSGIRWNIISMFFNLVGGLVQLYILVRLLEESDFGLMALLNVVMSFALIFMDFGVSNGIIHKKEVSPLQLSTLYWLTILLSLGISLIVVLTAPLMAWFYGEEALKSLLFIIAAGVLINSFSYPMRVLMNKQLKFDQLGIISIVAFICSFTATILLAINGFGVYSLVIGLVVRTVAEGILTLLLGWRAYGLRWEFNLKKVNFFLKFGSFQMGENLLTFFVQQFDTLLIGKLLGTEVLGSYDIIKRLLLRPIQTINPILTNVSFPLMSKVQKEIEQLSTIYLKQLNYICSLNFPIYLFLFFNSSAAIQFLFGPKWLAYETVFQLLAIAFAIMATGNPVGSLLLAKGRANWGFYWNLVLFTLIPAAIFVGAKWGILGIATILLSLQALLVLPNYLYLVKPLIRADYNNYFRQIFLPLLLALVMGLSTYLVNRYMPFDLALFWEISLLALIGGGVYLGLSYRFNTQFISDLTTLAGYGKH